MNQKGKNVSAEKRLKSTNWKGSMSAGSEWWKTTSSWNFWIPRIDRKPPKLGLSSISMTLPSLGGSILCPSPSRLPEMASVYVKNVSSYWKECTGHANFLASPDPSSLTLISRSFPCLSPWLPLPSGLWAASIKDTLDCSEERWEIKLMSISKCASQIPKWGRSIFQTQPVESFKATLKTFYI